VNFLKKQFLTNPSVPFAFFQSVPIAFSLESDHFLSFASVNDLIERIDLLFLFLSFFYNNRFATVKPAQPSN